MNIQPQHLRMHRKRAPLLQSDIAYILGFKEYSSISRAETGDRRPGTNMLLLYHIFFDMPLEGMYFGQKWGLIEGFIEKTSLLIEELKVLPEDRKVAKRISFLQGAIIKLTQAQHE